MHELSIAEEIVRAIGEELHNHPNTRLKSALVRVGELRLIEPATLEHCFEAATCDSPLAGAQLCVEQVKASARCRKCNLEFAVEHHWFECPQCGETGSELVRGDELQLMSFEIERETDEIESVVEGVYANQK
ncbi:MAG: hydrogenase maturation nickel metallochaperone HypA [Verrucomicrobiia bacterium]|jgi:hydrogenase nickel incorporation protein HypA/HybF